MLFISSVTDRTCRLNTVGTAAIIEQGADYTFCAPDIGNNAHIIPLTNTVDKTPTAIPAHCLAVSLSLKPKTA
ncbi:MAG: hypothetical protein ACLR56_12080 [Oscillospiraceae bacterium]